MTRYSISLRHLCHSMVVAFFISACEDNSEPKTQPQPKPLTWTVTTIVGNGSGFQDGDKTIAKFSTPIGLALTSNKDLLVSDYSNNLIRKVTSESIVSTEAGSGAAGWIDGSAKIAQFDQPTGIAIAPDGTIYITDRSLGKIRKISGGVVSTLAGGIQGNYDGIGFEAGFNVPTGITIGIDGDLYVTDQYNNSIRRITKDGLVTTFAGSKMTTAGYKDGFRTDALFNKPRDICSDLEGNLYIVEEQNHRIRKIDLDGVVSTVAGTGEAGFADGHSSEAKFYFLSGIAVSPAGDLYVTDAQNNKIRKVSKSGEVTTIAGSILGKADGEGASAKFWYPTDIIVATDGSLIVADSNNDRICRITPNN